MAVRFSKERYVFPFRNNQAAEAELVRALTAAGSDGTKVRAALSSTESLFNQLLVGGKNNDPFLHNVILNEFGLLRGPEPTLVKYSLVARLSRRIRSHLIGEDFTNATDRNWENSYPSQRDLLSYTPLYRGTTNQRRLVLEAITTGIILALDYPQESKERLAIGLDLTSNLVYDKLVTPSEQVRISLDTKGLIDDADLSKQVKDITEELLSALYSLSRRATLPPDDRITVPTFRPDSPTSNPRERGSSRRGWITVAALTTFSIGVLGSVPYYQNLSPQSRSQLQEYARHTGGLEIAEKVWQLKDHVAELITLRARSTNPQQPG